MLNKRDNFKLNQCFNLLFTEKIIDNNHVSRNQAHRIEVQSTKDKSKATNESNLHGETVNSEASTKPMNKITMISRAIQNEKYTTPVFTTYGQYFRRPLIDAYLCKLLTFYIPV